MNGDYGGIADHDSNGEEDTTKVEAVEAVAATTLMIVVTTTTMAKMTGSIFLGNGARDDVQCLASHAPSADSLAS